MRDGLVVEVGDQRRRVTRHQLEKFRKDSELSIGQFADLLRVDRAHLGRVLDGKRPLSAALALRALGIGV